MSKPLRALLLAAGLGTRLRPITNQLPKCLVPIGGEPLLGRWLRSLESVGCEKVLVNTHYHYDQVVSFLNGWKSSTQSVQIVYEPKLLGTAGTLLKNQSFFKNSTGLLIHADNAMEEGLSNFIEAHNKRSIECLITMLTFITDKPENCGIVELDNKQRVVAFHEKVKNASGNTANGAIYAFDNNFIEYLNSMQQKPNDFSLDVLPTLTNKIQTWLTKMEYIDIGTPDSLYRAQTLWNNQKREAKS